MSMRQNISGRIFSLLAGILVCVLGSHPGFAEQKSAPEQKAVGREFSGTGWPEMKDGILCFRSGAGLDLRFSDYGVYFERFNRGRGHIPGFGIMLDGARMGCWVPRFYVEDKEVFGEKIDSQVTITDEPGHKAITRVVAQTDTYSDLQHRLDCAPAKLKWELSWKWKKDGARAVVFESDNGDALFLEGLTYNGITADGQEFKGSFTVPAAPEAVPAEGQSLLPGKDASLKEITFQQSSWIARLVLKPDRENEKVRLSIVRQPHYPKAAIMISCEYKGSKAGEERSFCYELEVKRR